MKSLYEIVTAGALAAYWTEANTARTPFLGEALFPAKKKMGLNLKWIKGLNQLPVALMPSAFDAKPTLRDRLGVSDISTKMPFFREAMRIGEEDRQQLLMLLETGAPYVQEIVTRLFDDTTNLVDGALINPERMRMQLLVDGKISIKAPDDSGIVVNYEYNYDTSGAWTSSNTATLTGSDMWSDHENSKPITDMLTLKRKASQKGVELRRAICTTATWLNLMENKSVKMDMNVTDGQKIIMTDSMMQSYLLNKVGITFVIYDKMYADSTGAEKQYYPDNYVTFMPVGSLGYTWFGTTPEEADLMSGSTDANVSIVNTGVAILTKKESLPVNIITSVSEIVLPSFENMSKVYVLKTA